jgi:acetyltransferase-like isoleucine patch superfamily enzyme
VLFELETSKANVEIDCVETGYIYHNIKEGSIVKSGELLYCISENKINDFNYEIFKKDVLDQNIDILKVDDITFTKGANELIKKENIDLNKLISHYNNIDFISKSLVESYINSLNNQINDSQFKLKKIAFIGGGRGFSQCLDLILSSKEYLPTVIYDDTLNLDSNVHGILVKGKIDEVSILKDFNNGVFDYFIVTISTDLNFRKKIFNTLIDLSIPSFNLIHTNVSIGFNLSIGVGNVIFSSVNIGPEAIIGDNNFISSFSNIEHHCIIGSNCTFGPAVVLSGSVSIENNVKFGTGIFCEPSIKIGKDSIISSGSIITRDVKEKSVLITKIDQYYKK